MDLPSKSRYVSGKSEMGDVQVADLDKDGTKEIIVFISDLEFGPYDPPFQISVYRSDGSLWWTRQIFGRYLENATPVIGNFDNDPFDEIILPGKKHSNVSAETEILVYDHDGVLSTGHSEPMKVYGESVRVIMADTNNNGKNELIVRSNNFNMQINIFSNTGEVLETFEIPTRGFWIDPRSNELPAVGNFDDDDELELVIRYDYTQLAVLNMDGSMVSPDWPREIGENIVFRQPLVGDIDGNGEDDIIVVLQPNGVPLSGDNRVRLIALDRTGKIMEGWDELTVPPGISLRAFQNPVLADFNGDGKLEIAALGVGSFKNPGIHLFVYDHRGQVFPDWPQIIDTHTDWTPIMTVGDVTGDRIPDLILTRNTDYRGFEVFDGLIIFDGATIPSGPAQTQLKIEPYASSWVVIDDLEGDGMVDLIMGSFSNRVMEYQRSFGLYEVAGPKHRGSIYAWNMNQKYYPETMHWPTYQANTQHTGRFQVPSLVTPNVPPIAVAGKDQSVPDLFGDETVDFLDFNLIHSQFGQKIEPPDWKTRLDFDGDLIIGFGDFLILSTSFGSQPGDSNWSSVADVDGLGVERIKLEAAASYDPDGDIVSYRWLNQEGSIIVENATATTWAYFPIGSHTIFLEVEDNHGATGRDKMRVDVLDSNDFIFPAALSPSISEIIIPPPTPPPFFVDAGEDQSLPLEEIRKNVLFARAKLEGGTTGINADHPTPNKYFWFVSNCQQGPCTGVSVINPTDRATFIHFNQPGVYKFGLLGSNESDYHVDYVEIRVGSPQPRFGNILGSGPAQENTNLQTVFNPEKGEKGQIQFHMDHLEQVQIDIFDRWGRPVRSLVRRVYGLGPQIEQWDGRDAQGSMVPSGFYNVICTIGSRNQKSKLVVIK